MKIGVIRTIHVVRCFQPPAELSLHCKRFESTLKQQLQRSTNSSTRETITDSSSSLPRKVILGLDVNSKSTGYSLITNNGEILDCGAISTEKADSIYQRAGIIKSKLVELQKTHHRNGEQWHVAVEEFLKGFFGATWRTKDLFTLAQINSLVCYDCISIFNQEPQKIHPTTARAHFGLKKTDSNGVKDMVWSYVSTNFMPNFEWMRTSSGKLKDSSYDITDSMIIAKYAVDYLDNKTAPMKTATKKKKKKSSSENKEEGENGGEESVKKKRARKPKPKLLAEPKET